jgi:hypothetical protein
MQFFGSFFIRAGEADETRLRYWELSWYGGSAPQVSLTVLRDFSPVQTNPDGAFSCPIISPAAPGQTSLDSLGHNARMFCHGGEVAVDVVVTPAEFKPGTWMLTNRLRSPLGTIIEVSPSLFTIQADGNPGLAGMEAANFVSLGSAMSAIAKHMKGECQLASGRG